MKDEDKLRLVFQTLTEIAIIGRLADTALAKALPEGLSAAGFGVLNHFVRLAPGHESPAKLARAFQVTKGAMTYTLGQLEAQGYVAIGTDPQDARAKRVRITRAGRRARETGVASVAPGMKAMLDHIDAKEFASALPLLTKLRQMLDAARN